MGELGALFNPGMRHELEERQAKAARREEEGNARDGDLRIDLESGVAVINIPGADGDQSSVEGAASSGDTAATAASDDESGPAGQSTDTQSTDTQSADTESAAAAEAPPAQVLRPRGKRGLSASQR
jgi:hypothetical protein